MARVVACPINTHHTATLIWTHLDDAVSNMVTEAVCAERPGLQAAVCAKVCRLTLLVLPVVLTWSKESGGEHAGEPALQGQALPSCWQQSTSSTTASGAATRFMSQHKRAAEKRSRSSHLRGHAVQRSRRRLSGESTASNAATVAVQRHNQGCNQHCDTLRATQIALSARARSVRT